MKFCGHCGERRPETEFYRKNTAPDGLQAWCKRCMIAAGAARYRRNHRFRGRAGRPRKGDDAPPGQKRCNACGQIKPRAAYSINRGRWDGLQAECRECRRVPSMIARYGEQADRLTDPILLAARDRAERRRDLTQVGGLAGVRRIRQRYRQVRQLKELAHGRDIPPALLDKVLPR